MKRPEAFVYCWTDHGRDMKYIGVHKGSPDDDYACSSKPMKKEKKARPHDFTRKVLVIGEHLDMLRVEQELIRVKNAVKDPRYYNQANNIGPYHWDRTGITHTQKSKNKMSAAQKKSWTPKRRAQHSAAHKGKPLGPQTPEHIENHAASLRGKIQTPEHIENHAASLRGNPLSPEHRDKIAAAKAHDWWIGWPDGHEAIIRNLKAFCRIHGLHQGAMAFVSQGRRRHHKGFRCKKI